MSGRPGGETTGRIKRELAVEAHERAVHLIDLEAVRRVLSGIPAVLTELERGAVIALCDAGGLDATVTAQGLGIAPSTVDWTIRRHRRRAAALTRDLQAAVMLRPAAELVEAVAGGTRRRSRGCCAGWAGSSSRRWRWCSPPWSWTRARRVENR